MKSHVCSLMCGIGIGAGLMVLAMRKRGVL